MADLPDLPDLPQYAEPMCGWADDYEPCHCGAPLHYGYDGDATHHRGMCTHCDAVRCDAYPGECGR